MRKKISVIGNGVQIAQELARHADVSEDVHGADIVVLAGVADLEPIRDSAPAAAVLVTAEPVDEWCRKVCEGTFFPRSRIIGIPDPAELSAAAESIIFERGDEHDVVAMADGEFGPRRVRLGHRGITEVLER